MIVNKESLYELGININNYELGGWGASSQVFSVYKSVFEKFQVQLILIKDINTNEIVNELEWKRATYNTKIKNMDLGDELYNTPRWKTQADAEVDIKTIFKNKENEITEFYKWFNANYYFSTSDVKVFNASKCFNEIAITYLNAIKSTYEYFNSIPNTSHLDQSSIINLRYGIFSAIEYAIENRQLLEITGASGYTQENFNVTVDQTGWALTIDMFGKKALNYIENAELDKYKIIAKQDLVQYITDNGNIKIVNIKDIDELETGEL